MIINFTIENWKSFRDSTTFSMVASKERQHGDRVRKLDKYKPTKVLPTAVIFGGNASGKTNFLEALDFLKALVVYGSDLNEVIPVEPFKLDADCISKPSGFSLQILIDEQIYEFNIVVNAKEILEESLMLITNSSEKMIYHRKGSKIKFSKTIQSKELELLKFVFKATRSNQSFLYSSIWHNIDRFQSVYNWFSNTLQIVFPKSQFMTAEYLPDENGAFYEAMNEKLIQFDTGISRIDTIPISLDQTFLSDQDKDDLRKKLKQNMRAHVKDPLNDDRLIVFRENGELLVKKLIPYHKASNNENVSFSMDEESEGTQRIIDLLPAFLDLSPSDMSPSGSKVYMIDELDRSMHSLLVRELLDWYLLNCSTNTNTQLIITTHDSTLMNEHILRRDEMWLIERDVEGYSDFYPVSDFSLRKDKDIRKEYLGGHMGGVPRMI